MNGQYWDIYICPFPGPSGGWVVSTLDQDGMSPEPSEWFEFHVEALQFARSIVPDDIPATIRGRLCPSGQFWSVFPTSGGES